MYVTVCKADLRSWALGLGKGSSGVAVPAPNSANNYGKAYETCYVDALSLRGHSHAALAFSPKCSGSGYWKLQYKTDKGICTMFGDADQSGCPFTTFWTSKAQFVAKNGGNGEEYTDKGVTFIGCENGARRIYFVILDPVDENDIDYYLQNIADLPQLNEDNRRYLISPITIEDIIEQSKKAIGKQSSPGSDVLGYVFIHLIYQFSRLKDLITKIYNMALATGSFPSSWQDLRVRLLPKKGDLSTLKN
ncbi:hypothetical protein G6F57_012479 [Rhizopus arrhizus]|nr:hypothetical protein G6F30_013158 [Rhizopus arrhizus]KAG1394084.1 hypothetical protein G6F58_012185 [Rhizopus delemar]KAG0931178.1 hypothetical protein G6F32_011764 [Rhizopus arrhizus]KAG0974010.1 hypothetical protein G6F28_013400 [Rhizopus arrhizus]KAG1001124.1 hypothetical protein G6F27_013169 [Rhizopus arrhizus]